ncbi:MAG: hypothetical protein O9312_04990 [Hylemonella sp.]|nr:hypothetical protein [Hylemonella sp.]
MAGIKSRNTKPELKVRKALFSQVCRSASDCAAVSAILLPRFLAR